MLPRPNPGQQTTPFILRAAFDCHNRFLRNELVRIDSHDPSYPSAHYCAKHMSAIWLISCSSKVRHVRAVARSSDACRLGEMGMDVRAVDIGLGWNHLGNCLRCTDNTLRRAIMQLVVSFAPFMVAHAHTHAYTHTICTFKFSLHSAMLNIMTYMHPRSDDAHTGQNY
jgi:hypothetical protein